MLALLLVVGILLTQSNIVTNLFRPTSAYAIGDLTVTWEGQGTGNTGPIFDTDNMAPGQSETKTITVKNGDTQTYPLAIRGNVTTESILSGVLMITISENGTDLYGDTLTSFFADSQTADGIPLGDIDPSQTRIFSVAVTFDQDADNTYQNQTIVFNLVIGLVIDVPEACEALDIDFTNPIYGTERSEILRGTNGNDLIFALGGSDYVDGKGGDDCIIGGNGSDYINGGDGEDSIFGGPGSDLIIGGNQNDYLDGQQGSDLVLGGSGTDTCIGEAKVSCEL